MAEATTAQIRAWAKEQGLAVSASGRLPAAVREAWEQAHPPARPAAGRRTAPSPRPRATPARTPASPPPAAPPKAAAPPAPQAPAPPAPAPAPPPYAAPPPSGPPPYGPPPYGPPPYGPPPYGPPPSGPPPYGSASYAPPAAGEASPRPSGLSVAAFVAALLVGPVGSVLGLLALRKAPKGARLLPLGAVVLGLVWTVTVGVSFASRAERDLSGEVVGGGSVRTDALRTGDCVNDLDEGLATTVDVLPCAESHEGQVLAVFDLSGQVYPGDSDVVRLAEGGCTERVQDLLPPDDLEYGLFYFYPSASTWGAGDREVVCVVTGPDDLPLTGSLLDP